MTRRHFPIVLIAAFLTACVPVPQELMPKAPGSSAPAATSFPDIEPSGTTFNSLHFSIHGYNPTELQEVSRVAEDIFNRIGNDTGLYSYLAGQTFTLVVYKDQSEYQSKTKEPSSSRAIAAGTAVYTYYGPEMTPSLAHHMMHMIFNGYMRDKANTLNWIGEGLALRQELQWMPETERVAFYTTQGNKLRTDRMSFSQMGFYNGADEEHRKSTAWYLQVESVVSYLLKSSTSLTFAAFLNDLRNGADFDHAIANQFAGKYRGVADLQTSWENSL